MRILAVGSRRWDDRNAVVVALGEAAEQLMDESDTPVLITSCRNGLEEIAHEIADGWNWECAYYGIDREEYGAMADGVLNATMVSHGKPDLVLAFPIPLSPAVWGVIRNANERGIEVRIIPPEDVRLDDG